MTPTETKYVEKLKELIVNLKIRLRTKDKGIINTCNVKNTKLESEISALESEMEKEKENPYPWPEGSFPDTSINAKQYIDRPNPVDVNPYDSKARKRTRKY